MLNIILKFNLAALACFVLTAHAQAYNEATDGHGLLRPNYREFMRRSSLNLFQVDERQVEALMNMPLEDSVQILPVPSILSSADYRLMQRASVQRAEAMAEFYNDLIFNTRGHIYRKLFSDQDVQSVMMQESNTLDLESLRNSNIRHSPAETRYISGEDIARDENGEFKIQEENLNLIGGVSNIADTHRAFYRAHGVSIQTVSPLEEGVTDFLKDIPRSDWSEQTVAILECDGTAPARDHKTNDRCTRESRVIRNLGIPIVTYAQLNGSRQRVGLWRDFAEGKIKKIVNLQSPFSMGTSVDTKQLLMNQFRDRNVQFMTTPGIEFLTNKALLNYVDEFVRLYLNQEPLIKSLPTFPLEDVDFKGDHRNWVVKEANGLSGKGIYLGPSYRSDGWAAKMDFLKQLDEQHRRDYPSKFSTFVAQRYVNFSYVPSVLPDVWTRFNVEWRPLVFYRKGGTPPPAIWGRANLKVPHRLNNLGQNGFEVAVFSADLCERALLGY